MKAFYRSQFINLWEKIVFKCIKEFTDANSALLDLKQKKLQPEVLMVEEVTILRDRARKGK